MFFPIGERRIEVTVLHNGTAIEIGSEGVVIDPKPGTANKLALEVNLPEVLVAFKVVDREKNVHVLTPRASTGLVEVPIHTGYTPQRLWVSYYPNNHFRLLDLSGSELRIWEIGLVRQDDRFYLVAQQVYSVQLFRSDGRVVCPAFEREDHGWPQLVELLGQCYADRILSALPDDYTVPVLEAPVITDKHVGWVQWYNYASGVGVVHTTLGPARVHWSSLIQPDSGGFVGLEAGQMVGFASSGPNGGNSTIKFQVYGVKPISS